MAETQTRAVRIPGSMLADARRGAPELAGLDASTLVRAGLAVLAGRSVAEAISQARRRPGPVPGAGGRPRRGPAT